jgi:transcriptional regulator ATRX
MPQAYSNNGLTPPTPDDDEDGEDEVESDPSWWVPFVKDREGLKDAENGYKIVVLLHILAYAKAVGDKVLVFSSCLRTLNYIESVLERSNWSTFVSSLDDDSIGAYKKNEDYFRIDGNTQAWERGKIVDDFNDSAGNARLLLISSKAGGVGINLVRKNGIAGCHTASAMRAQIPSDFLSISDCCQSCGVV